MLPHIDAQHTNRQLHDALDALVHRLLPWQHAYLVLGRPDKDEDTQLWLAIHHLETLNPTAAQQTLKDCTHPLPRAIFLWLEALQRLINRRYCVPSCWNWMRLFAKDTSRCLKSIWQPSKWPWDTGLKQCDD